MSPFTSQFTIPSGYPPPDKGLRNWFTTLNHHGNQKETSEWLRGLLYSLLCVTLEKLKFFEGSVVYNQSDQNLIAVRIPQGRRTSLVGQNSTSLKFKSDSVNWRFVFAAA